jgi:hypothetical protein
MPPEAQRGGGPVLQFKQRSGQMNFGRSIINLLSIFILSSPMVSWGQTTSVAAPAETQQVKTKTSILKENAKFFVDAHLGAKDILDEKVSSTGARASLVADGTQKFSNFVSAHMRAGAYFGENTAADLYGKEGGSYSSIGVEHAYVALSLTKEARVDVGVLERNFSTLPATFRTDGFLGIQESYTVGDKKASYFEVNASQILPSSSTAEKRAGKDREIPTLMMAGGDTGIQLHRDMRVKLKAQYFSFSNLTSIAAHSSRGYNSVYGTGEDAARFAYRFEGVQASTSIENQWSAPLKTALHLGYILNRKAAPGTGEGYSAALEATYKIGDIELKPLAGIYYNESDVLPAVYADVTNALGKTNRIAQSYYLKVAVPDQNYSFYGRYVQTDVLDTDTARNILSDRRIISLGMEATYDIL